MTKQTNMIKPISEINIIRFLLYNPSYRSTVFSSINKEMFKDQNCSEIYETIKVYYERYNKFPTSNIETAPSDKTFVIPFKPSMIFLTTLSLSLLNVKFFFFLL